jgi:hypothetical protein
MPSQLQLQSQQLQLQQQTLTLVVRVLSLQNLDGDFVQQQHRLDRQQRGVSVYCDVFEERQHAESLTPLQRGNEVGDVG